MRLRFCILAPLLGLLISLSTQAALPGKPQQLSSPDQTPQGLEKRDWQSIRAAHTAWQHSFKPVEDGWQARNPGLQWTTRFDARGFTARAKDADWLWGLELRSYGFGEKQEGVDGKPEVRAAGQRLSYQWDANVQEWYVNDQRGLEHGFNVAQRPAGVVPGVPLDFVLGTRGSLTANVAADAQTVYFRDAAGAPVVTYAGLKVWDADGQVLPSRFVAGSGGSLILRIEEGKARYPLVIDPIAQQAYVKASNTGADDQFGSSVAVSGDTVVVGAHNEDSSTTGVNSVPNESSTDSGAAYVFVRSGTTWSQQAYLKASNTGAGDGFGSSVAVNGSTVVVGAVGEASSTTGLNSTSNNSSPAAGAAYVYVRSGTTWSQQTYMKASNTGPFDQFGSSVSVSGDTVVVGAYGEDSSTTGVNSTPNEGATASGAAYVYVRSGTTWSQQAYLKASNTGAEDVFGSSVAASGDTVVVGAYQEDSSTTGINSTPDDGSINAGAAYVFVRSGTAWSQQAYLKASNTGETDNFGWSVAVSGDSVVVGALYEDSATTGINSTPDEGADAAGAAYVYLRSGTTWNQQAYLKASNTGASDYFGSSVAVSGDTVVVGAMNEDSSTTGINSTHNNSAIDSGAAYVYVRSGTMWNQQAYLKASNTGAGDRFGLAVSVSGDTVAVGSDQEDSSTTGINNTPDDSAPDSGAVYMFAGLGPVPTVTNVSPISGPSTGGAVVSLTGASFFGTPAVTFNGTAASSVTVNSETQITATTPGGTPGPVSVVVTTASGSSVANSLYTYTTPEINLQGNSLTIVSGDNTPRLTDHTDFGPVLVDGGTLVRTYTVQNLGDGQLNLSGSPRVVVGGPHSGEFTVTQQPDPSFAPATSGTFQVTFDPSAVGLRSATLSIANNDINENTYSFSIQGTGDVPPGGGSMVIAPTSPLAASSAFTVSFSGWTDANTPLQYAVFIDATLVSAQGSSANRNLTAPTTAGTYTLKGQIYDALGNITEVSQTFEVNYTPQQKFQNAMTAAGQSGGNADATASPSQDNVANLLKYAFNLDLLGPDRRTLTPGTGTAGLPVITFPSAGVMRVEYLRRIGSGLIYTPKKGSSPQPGSWQNLSAPGTVTPIDANWERVHHDEPFTPGSTPAMYGTVEVTLP